jgi:uncharacterized membrane protein YgaE (UPF0421/DUF939 family)
MTRSVLTTALQLSIRSALAASLALVIAQFLKLPFPIYAMISAVIVTDLSASRTRQLAVPRLIGTVFGATLGAVVNQLLPHSVWGIGLSILIAMFLIQLLRLPEAAKLAGYVCAIVMLDHGDKPWSYALWRVIETILGIGLAILVSLVPKLIRIDEPKQDGL